jgi:hypothetical protein
VDNAVKYTQDGEKTVTIRAHSQADRVVLEFMDRGIGIPPGEERRVFEMFYRSTTAGERRGAGLGLALVHHCVTAHGGTIQALPRSGGGTTFRIEYPATAPVPAITSNDTPRPQPASGPDSEAANQLASGAADGVSSAAGRTPRSRAMQQQPQEEPQP